MAKADKPKKKKAKEKPVRKAEVSRKEKAPNKLPFIALVLLVVVLAVFLVFYGSKFLQNIDLDKSRDNQTGQNLPIEPQAQDFLLTIEPLRESFYRGGRIVIFTSLLSNTDQNYRFNGEWFSVNRIGNETVYAPIKDSPYSETFDLKKGQYVVQYRWFSISEANVASALFLGNAKPDSGTAQSKNATVKIVDMEELAPYLSANEKITINDSVTIFALKNLPKTRQSDEEHAKLLLKLTRSHMSFPNGSNETDFFEKNELDSLSAFERREGTASEFCSVYVMLLQAVGIPSRVIECQKNGEKYFIAEVFLEERNWTEVDVYNPDQQIGEETDKFTSKRIFA